MAQYVDGFVLTIAKKNLMAYKRMARKAGRIWRDYGALAYVECALDDPQAPGMVPFPRLAGAKDDQVVIFAWAIFKSRRERDRANAAIMNDPRIREMGGEAQRIVDCAQMTYGGFKVIAQL